MPGRLSVHFLPALADPDELRDATAVVIDLLRASTTICYALAAGARVVVTGNPVRDPARIRASYPSFKDDPDPKIVDVRQIRLVNDSWSWGRPDGGTPQQCRGK